MKEFDPVERLTWVRDLFEEVSSLPASERAGFLDKNCGGDGDLYREVTALLLEAETADSPIDGLVNNMIWPALESLSHDPSRLEDWLDGNLEAGSTDPLIGRTISRFEILELIGRGGMGMVYRALDRTLDRIVALKFLPPSLSSDAAAKDRFVHEAKAASGLNHPNIATVYEIGETGDHQLYIAMGYYPGKTLKDKIAKGTIQPDAAIDMAIQLASGLQKAHEQGVTHRDIKPGNIIITEERTLVLLDFGLAKLSYESGYTQVGQMAGTLAYMSPEQARSGTIDERTDIWSFGVVFYEMLTGRLPFSGENAQTAIRAILEEKPEPPSKWGEAIPAPLETILGRCLMKDPDKRYQRAEQLCEDLERARTGLAPKHRSRPTAWKSRSRLRWAAAVGLLLGGAVAVMTILLQNRPTLPSTTFIRITEGPLVEDLGHFVYIAWGDYDREATWMWPWLMTTEVNRSTSFITAGMVPLTGSPKASSPMIRSHRLPWPGRTRTTTAI
jgi:serine/threonine-protein kinase